jgi:hypothetical protein
MNFYNNIFASSYRVYNDNGSFPRNKAATFVSMFMFGNFSVIILLIRDLFNLRDFFIGNSLIKGFIFLVAIGMLALSWNYYSEEKSEFIVSTFEEYSKSKRQFWGYITVIFFTAEWILFIYLL